MIRTLKLEKVYSQSVEHVWDAITDGEAMERWLMEPQGFQPKKGAKFDLICPDFPGGKQIFKCQVLELDKPNRMIWSWIMTGYEDDPMRVEFVLANSERGTKLTLTHTGKSEILKLLEDGWKPKLDTLQDAIK